MFYPTFLMLCEQKRVKQTRALLDAGVPKSAYQYWKKQYEAGEDPKPTNQNAVKLADYFGVTVDYLLTGKQKEKAPGTDAGGYTDEERETINLLRMLPEEERRAQLALLRARVKPK